MNRGNQRRQEIVRRSRTSLVIAVFARVAIKMDFYDMTTTAGEGYHLYSRTLHRLATLVRIPPPTFHGKIEYREGGLEKWSILTTIPACPDYSDEPLAYSEEYPDWLYSVEVAMQGAIARICHKYRTSIPLDSPFRLFGTRREDGKVFFRHGDFDTLTLRYLYERESGSRKMEVMLRDQIAIMDHLKGEVETANTRNETLEQVILTMDDKMTKMDESNHVIVEEKSKLEAQVVKLEDRIKLLKDPLKMEVKLLENEVWISTLHGGIIKMGDTFTETLDEKTRLEKENEKLKKEAEALKKEAEALKKETEALKKELAEATAEEDPAERLMFGSDGEEVPIEEWEDYLSRKEARKAKRRCLYPLACLDRIKRR